MYLSAQDFLASIYEDYLDEGLFGIFVLPEKRMKWFQTPTEAGAYAEKLRTNVYFSVGVCGYNPPKSKHSEADVIGLTCFHVDVDVKNPEIHQKENLPETKEEALELIESGIPESPPSIVIDTGNGLQAFWVFNEPWIFETDEEKVEAKQMAKRFHRTIGYAARAKGWTVDATHNLDRVMRVCGTKNYKGEGEPKDVTLVKKTEHLYNPEDFDDVLMFTPGEDMQLYKEQSFNKGEENPYGITLIETAVLPEKKFQALMEEAHFKQLWNKQLDVQKMRKKQTKDGTPAGDASLSSYDMSLANHAAIWGWAPQEIANLIIAFRRKHMTKQSDLKKALRYKYISDLILKANSLVIKQENNERLEKLNEKIVQRQISPNPEPISKEEWEKEVEEARVSISHSLKIRIEHINKYLSDPPYYELILADGAKVPVGSASQLLNQGNLKIKIFEAISRTFESVDRKTWNNVISSFGHLTQHIDTADETRDEDGMRVWIHNYLDDAEVWEDPDDAVLDKRPFISKGRTYVFGESLKKNINLKGEKINDKDMGKLMSRLGCKHKRFHFKIDNKRTTKGVYDVTAALKQEEEAAE